MSETPGEFSFPERHEPNPEAIDQQVDEWKHAPTFLASSSAYRQRELASIGFDNVTTIPVPDQLELELQAEIRQEQNAGMDNGHYDPFYTEAPGYIAHEKVRFLLEHEHVPPEALVCGFDTMPMRFRNKLLDKKRSDPPPNGVWQAEHIAKPKTAEEARELITNVFLSALEGDNTYQQILAAMNNLSDDAVHGLEVGYLSRLIRVNTGYAVRLPHTDTIQTDSSYVNLALDAVFECKDDYEQLELLVDEVVAMQEHNGTLLSVAGGIDYANPELRELLKIREVMVTDAPSEVGLYKGLPATAFDQFLHQLAKQQLRQ
jgi:hypothetical protein